MRTLVNIILFFSLSVIISCRATTQKHKRLTKNISFDSLNYLLPNYVSAIKKNKNRYEIDSNVILENKNLPQLVQQLDTSNLESYFKFNNSPKFIRTFLNEIYREDFNMADTGQHFAAGCIRFGNEPFRQLQYFGLNNEFFLMTYKTGGWALPEQIVIIKFKDSLVVDFWTGGSSGDLNSKTKTLSFLSSTIRNKRTNNI